MRGHLQCRDTLAGNDGCPLKTGTTVLYCPQLNTARGTKETQLSNDAETFTSLAEISYHM